MYVRSEDLIHVGHDLMHIMAFVRSSQAKSEWALL